MAHSGWRGSLERAASSALWSTQASLQVNRRARPIKTDRVDVKVRLRTLIAALAWATTAFSAKTPSRLSSARLLPTASGHQACALPTSVHALLQALVLFRQLARGFRAADLRPHLAALSGRHPPRSPRAPLPISCAGSAWMASSSVSPTACAIASPTPACASPCSSRAPTIACCAPPLLPRYRRYALPQPSPTRLQRAHRPNPQQSNKPTLLSKTWHVCAKWRSFSRAIARSGCAAAADLRAALGDLLEAYGGDPFTVGWRPTPSPPYNSSRWGAIPCGAARARSYFTPWSGPSPLKHFRLLRIRTISEAPALPDFK